jgi:hypothetical protein
MKRVIWTAMLGVSVFLATAAGASWQFGYWFWEWSRLPSQAQSLYMAGVLDGLYYGRLMNVTVKYDEECLQRTKLSPQQVADEVLAYAKINPDVDKAQILTVAGAVGVYLATSDLCKDIYERSNKESNAMTNGGR